MWIGIDDAEILIEDLLFEEERVDLRVSFLGEGATARAKDKLENDAIISVFFLNIYIFEVVLKLSGSCLYIYMCVWSEDFSPLKKKGWLNSKHKHVSGSHFLSLSLSLWTLSLSLSVPNLSLFCSKKKKIESKKRRIFSRIPYNFTPFCFSRYITWNYSLSARIL